jgi:hypothetical protein
MGGIIHVVCKRTVHSKSVDIVKKNRFNTRHISFGVGSADIVVAR